MQFKSIFSIVALLQIVTLVLGDSVPIFDSSFYKDKANYSIIYPANSIPDAAEFSVRARIYLPQDGSHLTSIETTDGLIEKTNQPDNTSAIGSWTIPESALDKDIGFFFIGYGGEGQLYNQTVELSVLGGYTLENGTSVTFSTTI